MSSKITNPLYICAGVFPENMEMFTGFAEAYLNSLPEVDLTGIWYNPGEQRLLKNNAKKTQFTELANLEPHYSTAPWPVHTPGLKVLVITSFVHSSRAQACELEGIWPQYDGLFKQCNFTFIQAPPHAALVPPKHKSWLEGLNDLKAQMDAVDYDILIVGAGAWGLPLAVHAKLSGKIGYHLGGATQLLFGIKGKRWDDHPIISKLYNEHWTRPLAEEVPQKKAIFENTEGTGYW
ncbi:MULTISPECIES: hypothetical protein [unclassified Lentimonas]|uniref:hypothetical protein n=1 Tax=unclassified Lentimonas TaxID=2630993 RepID=UPI00138A1419|nr:MULTISPECIES: hypothetical protein [unclassified Lentimonas]